MIFNHSIRYSQCHRASYWFWLLGLISLLCLSIQAVQAQDSKPNPATIEFTPAETAWLAQNPTIIVGGEPDWAPFDFVDKQGDYQGVAKDYLKHIKQTTGLKINLQIAPWNELLSDFKQQKIDLLPAIYHSPEREQFAHFTQAYSQHAEFIFVRSKQEPIRSLQALTDKKVVVVKGYSIASYLRQRYPDIQLITQPSILDALDLLLTGQVDAFINDMASTSFIAKKYNLLGFEPSSLLNNRINQLHMASRQGAPLLASIIDKALHSMSAQQKQAIGNKWQNLPNQAQPNSDLHLTPKEQQWLKQHPVLYTTSDPNWLPYEATNNKGEFIGMFSDLTYRMAQKLKVKIKYRPSRNWTDVLSKMQNKEVDFVAAIPNQTRKEYMHFTAPIFNKELSLVTQKNHPIITSLSALDTKKIGIVKQYGYQQKFIKRFPMHDYTTVTTIQEGLKALKAAKIDILVANTTSTLYYMTQLGINDLKIAGNPDLTFDMSYGVRDDWPILQGILQKALDSIAQPERQKMLNRWVQVDVVQQTNYQYVYQVAAIFALVVALILLWVSYLKKEIKQRKQMQAQLMQAHRKTQTIFDNAKNILVVTGPNGLSNANQALLDFLGYDTLADLLAQHQSMAEFFIPHPDYFAAPKGDDPTPWYEAIRQQPETQRLVLMRGKNSPEVHIFAVHISEITPQESYVAAFTDVTDLKQESRLYEHNASHDALTKLYNRFYIDRFIAHELALFAALRDPISVILLDIDWFKDVNDQHGHLLGDSILQQLADLLQQSVRFSDKVARWGGEEFLIVLPGSELKAALQLAEKIRHSLTHQRFPKVGSITCSYGVATAKADDTIEKLINRADKRLYRAKEQGRDQIIHQE